MPDPLTGNKPVLSRIIDALYPWTVGRCPTRAEIAAELLGTSRFFSWRVETGKAQIPLGKAAALSAKLKARAAVLQALAAELDAHCALNAHKTPGWNLRKAYKIAK